MCSNLKNLVLVPIVLVAISLGFISTTGADQPNVLFISIDDLNDWVGVFGGHPQVKTPNIDEFARAGSVIFQNAHCPGPVCGSCRSALLSGFMPHTTGIYGNSQNMRNSQLVKENATLPEYFSKYGYYSLSRGKIFHKHHDENGSDSGHWAYNHWEKMSGGSRVDKSQLTSRNSNLIHGKPGPVSEHSLNASGTEFSWGPTQGTKEDTRDYQTAKWAGEQLNKQHDKPFFMAVGISRPHLPFYVPQEYFDLYDIETFKSPEIREDDLHDILVKGKNRPKFSASGDYKWLKQHELIDECAMAYAAACSYADDCVGVILDALEKSPHKDNTIVVIWGDHGWHLGEKLRYRKTTGWNESTRVPLVVRLPNMKNGKDCHRPVNLIDLFPTLIELCKLPGKPSLDGTSFVPLLADPDLNWKPTLTVFGKDNSSIHGERYHYMHHRDGTEEFYDLSSDPMEWTNLISRLTPEQLAEKNRLAQFIPTKFAAAIPSDDKKHKKTAKTLNQKIKSERDLNSLK